MHIPLSIVKDVFEYLFCLKLCLMGAPKIYHCCQFVKTFYKNAVMVEPSVKHVLVYKLISHFLSCAIVRLSEVNLFRAC